MQRGRLFDTLAGGDAPLDQAQAALVAAREAWRGDPRCAAFFAAFADYGAGGPSDAFMDPAGAQVPVAVLADRMLAALAAHPLGHAPFRNGCDGGTRTLLLAQEGRALLLLVAREPGRYPRRAVGFSTGELREVVLAGSAAARIVRRAAGVLAGDVCQLGPGARIALDQSHEALLVDVVETRLVSLRLVRTPEHPMPTREYALETGELLHQSSGDAGESSQEFALALLGRMGRADAAPVMAEMTREGSDHLRWQALRECLALDTAAGLAALRMVAGDPADSLHGPASALLGQLCAAHPELAALEPA